MHGHAALHLAQLASRFTAAVALQGAGGASIRTRAALAPARCVRPEGGLTAEEIERATAAGMHACRAGPRVMRTETAALALVAALQLHFGDLGRG